MSPTYCCHPHAILECGPSMFFSFYTVEVCTSSHSSLFVWLLRLLASHQIPPHVPHVLLTRILKHTHRFLSTRLHLLC